MLRRICMLAVAALSVVSISSCNKDLELDDDSSNSEILRKMTKDNRTVSIDGDIEFQILTPNGLRGVGYKSFTMSAKEDANYPELNGTSFFAVTAEGRYANEMFSIMAHSQNLSKSKPGDKLDLKRVSCGNFASNNSEIAFGSFEGGDIYVKSLTETSITLRFVKVKTKNGLGKAYFNGDLTFDID